jgi:hypothetical protein
MTDKINERVEVLRKTAEEAKGKAEAQQKIIQDAQAELNQQTAIFNSAAARIDELNQLLPKEEASPPLEVVED